MATPSSVAKKAANQTRDILAAVEGLVADVAGMKAAFSQPEVVELEVNEAADRTGEILAAVSAAFDDSRDQSRRIMEAVTLVATEMIALKSEVVELKTMAETAKETGKQLERIIDMASTIDAEMIALRSEIGIVRRMQETRNLAQDKPAATRKAKK